MIIDADTLYDLRARAAALVRDLDILLDGVSENAALRSGKTLPAIVAVVASKGPIGPMAIAEELRRVGREVSDDAVATGCARLVKAGRLRRAKRGAYVVAKDQEAA